MYIYTYVQYSWYSTVFVYCFFTRLVLSRRGTQSTRNSPMAYYTHLCTHVCIFLSLFRQYLLAEVDLH